MDKKEILQFEADDASKTGINGKQVFFTKRINGETIHNKETEEFSKFIPEIEEETKNEDLFIEFKNIRKSNLPPSRKITNKKNKNNKNYINKNKEFKNRNNNNNRKNIRKNVKKKKKIKNKKYAKKRRILKVLFILLIVIGIAVFAMVSPIFNIEHIEVKGNNKIDSNTIVSLSGVSEGKNIFQVSKKNTIKNIKDNPYINSVTIKRKLPATIEINVKERKVAYQLKVINSYVYIDYQGYILEVASQKAKVPLIEGLVTEQDTLLNGKRISNDDIEYLNTLLRIMETAKTAEVSDFITKIIIQNNEYLLYLKSEKKTAYLGKASNLTNQMAYLKLILEKEKGKRGKVFVNGDINSGFKPYFREE